MAAASAVSPASQVRRRGGLDIGNPTPLGATRTTPPPPIPVVARHSQIAGAESGATGNSSAKQLGCARKFVGLSANPIGHLERVRNPAGQKQSGDVRVGDVESHMRGVERPRRDVVAGLRDVDGFVGAARVRRDLSEHPGYLRTDDGNVGQREAFRGLHRRLRLVHREPVHGQKGIDVRSRIRGCVARRLVDDLFARAGSPSAHNILLDRRNANLALSWSVISPVGYLRAPPPPLPHGRARTMRAPG